MTLTEKERGYCKFDSKQGVGKQEKGREGRTWLTRLGIREQLRERRGTGG